VLTQIGQVSPIFGRVSLASGGTTVYAMVGDENGGSYQGFMVSNNLGASGSWSAQTVPSASFTSPNNVIIDGTGSNDFSQSFYDQALAVAPGSSSTVFFGGVGLY
jgi:hypothetical protein